MDPRSGLLGNRYELGSLIATGGMGQVWRARDTVLGRPVAVKLLRPEFTGSPDFLTRFRGEAQHAAALNHPNIAAVHDYGETTGAAGEPVAYLVMELVDGESLAALLERAGRLDAARTLGIVRQAAAALATAHAAGVVHRDVKPANVLVRPDGVVKLTDFGIAWSAASAPVTRTGQVIGTAAYLAPEQVQGAQATPAGDVYALGMVAYECLAGRPAFDGETSVRVARQQIDDPPPPLPPDVPGGLRRLVAAALVKDTARRVPDGAALLAAADRVAGDGGGSHETVVLPAGGSLPRRGPAATAVLPASDPPAAAHTGPRRARGRALLAAVVGVVALVLLGTVVLATRGGGSAATAASTTSRTSARPTTSAPPSSTTAAPATVDVVPADYLGRPVEEARARLIALGLRVAVTPVPTAKVAAGLVVAVDPDGALAPGGLVTLSAAVAPPQVTTPAVPTGAPGHGKGHHKRHGDG